MVRGFERRTGIQVDYTGTRDADAVLASDIKDGNPPDLAVLSRPGELRQDAADGTLVPIDAALNQVQLARQYAPGWREPHAGGRAVGGPALLRDHRQGRAEERDLVRPAPVPGPRPGHADLTRPDLGPAHRPGPRPGPRRRDAVVPGPGGQLGLRLAGDRLDRGHRAAPVRAEDLRRVGGGHAALDLGPDPAGLAGLRQRGQHPRPGPRRLRGRAGHQLRPGRPAHVHQPARLLPGPRGLVHHRVLRPGPARRLPGPRTRGRGPTSTSSRSRR